MYYDWLSDALKQEFESLKLLKESERGTVTLVRHRASGQKFILRSFLGNGEVYQRLLSCECANLPTIYEVASKGNKIWFRRIHPGRQHGRHAAGRPFYSG